MWARTLESHGTSEILQARAFLSVSAKEGTHVEVPPCSSFCGLDQRSQDALQALSLSTSATFHICEVVPLLLPVLRLIWVPRLKASEAGGQGGWRNGPRVQWFGLWSNCMASTQDSG